MISNEDKVYINDNDYNIALGRVLEFGGYDSDSYNNTADRIYPFSNENITESLEDIDLEGKSVITVGSSGDQVLNSILKGATNITLIDGNPLARYYVELKIAAIRNLEYEECLSFLTAKNILSYKYYQKISHDLSDDAKLFWDSIMLEMSTLTQKVLLRNIFHHGGFNCCQMANSFYRSEDEYVKLKRNIYNVSVKYLLSEFNYFPEVLGDEKADLIMLSNVVDYLSDKDYKRVVRQLYDNNLNVGGIIQVNYNFLPDGFINDENALGKMAYYACPDSIYYAKEVASADAYLNIDGMCVDSSCHFEDRCSCEFIEKPM